MHTALATRLFPLAAVLLVAVGCSSAEDPAGTPTVAPGSPADGGPGDGTLATALAVVPDQVETFTVLDHAFRKESWGVPDIGSADVDTPAFDTWMDHGLTATGGHTSQHLVQMAREWGWSELDLQWEVNLHGTDGPPVSVLAFEDDVDMQVVLDSLTEEVTAGGEKPGGTEARPQFHLPLAVGAIRPFLDATVLPDRKLLVVGSPDDETHQAVLARLDGEQAAPSDAVTALVDPIGPAETLLVDLRSGSCGAMTPWQGSRQPSPEAITKLMEELEARELAPVRGSVVAVEAEDQATIVARYADAATASADLPRRTALFEEGTDMTTAQPLADLLTVDSLEVDDDRLVYDLSGERSGRVAYEMWVRAAPPWVYC